MVVEPLPWPGNPARPIDENNRGKYFFEVVDAASGRTIFSRGFASIYGEWETTAEAKAINRTFSESLRFPLVERPARIVLKKRDARNAFREIWTFTVDPSDRFIERGVSTAAGPLIALQDSGDPARKLDLLILGDGYTAAERAKFERDARRLVDTLFATAPFRERRRDINVWGLCPPAAQSGPGASLKERARRTMEEGYRAFRIAAADPPIGGVFDARAIIRRVANDCRETREGVGPDCPW